MLATPQAYDTPHILGMSPVFCATAAPIREPFTITAVTEPSTNAKSKNAAYAPHAFATRNCTRATG